MTQSETSLIDARRRKVQYRAWHRGMREMDLIFGKFVDQNIALLSESDLDALEVLMEEIDRDIFMWLTGEITVPAQFDTEIYRAVKEFHTHLGPIHI
jgi:antitoxin CptB